MTHLILEMGAHVVRFSQGGLLCMAKWFDLSKDYGGSQTAGDYDVDDESPACAKAAPDLAAMGGGTMLMGGRG